MAATPHRFPFSFPGSSWSPWSPRPSWRSCEYLLLPSFWGQAAPRAPLGGRRPGGMGRGEGRMGRPTLPDGYGNTWGCLSSCHRMGGDRQCHRGLQAQPSHFLTHFFLFFFSFFPIDPQGPQGFQGPPGEPGEPGASVSPATSSSSLTSHGDGDKAACSQPWPWPCRPPLRGISAGSCGNGAARARRCPARVTG